ncbi:plastocyanin/azurin family copper-binding protein [Halalkalicoccus sp. NIPERK01]|uniref:plastocyanin/azurin family copper-binding protein n=1 Tax=Halalkalicoccus sp. NIPERK01 TaxID=3053469 RepID=UPI00256EEF70|nr:plastocyanin/azurin family copper-binding protein [Halalkalicoccus sp. NIPERK01]MDL5363205.1 SHOCT domain-containing protein [Halalkalicoccus sp. NIPERK01]
MTYSRRQFLGALGASTVATAGLTRPVTAQETPVVRMGNNYFDPIGLHVEPGTTVRFEIAAGTHSATAYESRIPSDASAFDSGVISSGGFEHTFEEPGTYDYYCIPHKSVGMVGRIVVGSPGGPAEASPIPDGDVPESDAIVEQGAIAYGSSTGGTRNSDGGMMGPGMGSGPGMMNGRNGGWGGGLPLVGGALGLIGLVGGLLYWALGRGDAPPESDDSAMETLQRRYARGEIDEAEFQRRRERLVQNQEN